MAATKTKLLILLFILAISCGRKNESDVNVISEIFPELIDSLRISDFNFPPPPLPPIFDKEFNIIGIDTIAANKLLEKYKQRLDSINLIDKRLLLGLVDSNLPIDFNDLRQIEFFDNLLINEIVENNLEVDKPRSTWSLNQFKVPENYQLILESDLNREYPNTWEITNRKFGGILAFSKVYFDEEKNYGILIVDYYPFKMEGISYFVIIENLESKWKLKKMILNWIT